VRTVRQLAMNLSFLCILALAGLMLVPAAVGFHRYVILTGSMTGTYDRGAIVFDKAVPTSELRVKDAITYAPPPGASSHDLVTHRIFKISTARNGARVFQTKGDANKSADSWTFMLPQPTQDRVEFSVPYVGFVFEVLSMRQFRVFLIGVPAVLAAFAIGMGMWREAGSLNAGDADAMPRWGAIDHDMPAAGALGRLPAAAPVFVALPVAAELRGFTWSAPEPT
jgi:signal peptidase I